MKSKEKILLITEQSSADIRYGRPRCHQLRRRNTSTSLQMWRNTTSSCKQQYLHQTYRYLCWRYTWEKNTRAVQI